jgi:hypothetical protein
MMGARCWTRHEDNLLREGRLNNESFDDIALKVGRSVKACRNRFDKAQAGMGQELKDIAEIREAYRLLGEATNALIAKMRPCELRWLNIGTMPRTVEPGTENILRGQLAERRLAA